MTYLSIVSVLPAEDGGQHAFSLEKQTEGSAQKQRKALLWTESDSFSYKKRRA